MLANWRRTLPQPGNNSQRTRSSDVYFDSWMTVLWHWYNDASHSSIRRLVSDKQRVQRALVSHQTDMRWRTWLICHL